MAHTGSRSTLAGNDEHVYRTSGTVDSIKGADATSRLHIMITVNAAWNVWNFRRALIREMIAEGHTITILAPPDDSVPHLEAMGCRFMPLAMSPGGLNPLEGASLIVNFRKAFLQQRPSVILGYTVKNNIFGSIAAKSLRIPFIPNVTGQPSLQGRRSPTACPHALQPTKPAYPTGTWIIALPGKRSAGSGPSNPPIH
jgi:hypothetical protein